jgi:hypothetical protein
MSTKPMPETIKQKWDVTDQADPNALDWSQASEQHLVDTWSAREGEAQLALWQNLHDLYKRDGYIDINQFQYPRGYNHPSYDGYSLNRTIGVSLHAVTKIQLGLLKQLSEAWDDFADASENYNKAVAIFHSDVIKVLSMDLEFLGSNQQLHPDVYLNDAHRASYSNRWLFPAPEAFDSRDVLGQWMAGTMNDLDSSLNLITEWRY